MLEICFATYRRYDKIPELMRQFREQTNQNFMVNVWNNGNKWIDTRKFYPKRVRIIQSHNGNIGSQARFRIVPMISGNPIIFIDDDISLEKDFVNYYYRKYLEYGKNCILGWFAHRWQKENYHKSEYPLENGEEADYIGTGGMILDRAIFDKEPLLQNIPDKYSKVEDLYLSYLATTKYKMRLIKIQPKCKIVYDGYDQYKKLKDYKQNAFLSLRKEGWKLLKDE